MTRKGLLLFILGLFSLPQLVLAANSQTFTTSGTFTVPSYGTITVELWGGGGAGGGAGAFGNNGYSGYAGGQSKFNGVTANGGAGGIGSNNEYGNTGSGPTSRGSGGAGGTWSGGSSGDNGDDGEHAVSNTRPGHGGNAGGTGGSGGTYGNASYPTFHAGGYDGTTPGGGGGGADWNSQEGGGGGGGGYTTKTWVYGGSGAPTVGANLTVTVGAGGLPNLSSSGDGGYGARGEVRITWTAAPTCSTSLSPSSVNQGNSATLSWSSSGSTQVYIANVGWVGTSGSTSVTPSSSTLYSCYGYNSSTGATGTWNSTDILLTVHASCSLPWGGSISHGQSVTAYQAATVPYGSSCSSQTRSCADGSLSGSYQYQSCSVTPAANCTLDGVTVNHGSSRTFYSVQTVSSGQLCSSYSQSRTCTNGTLSGSSSYQYATCSCTDEYICSGDTIQHVNTSCGTTNITTCVSPQFCSAGSSICLAADPDFGPGETGHLSARPGIVRAGHTTRVFWDVSNVGSCTVTGTNGDSWTVTGNEGNGWTSTSGVSGRVSLPITQKTTFTMTCDTLSGTPATFTETVDVLVIPTYEEV